MVAWSRGLPGAKPDPDPAPEKAKPPDCDGTNAVEALAELANQSVTTGSRDHNIHTYMYACTMSCTVPHHKGKLFLSGFVVHTQSRRG